MTDFNEDQARQDKLEQLYANDGRHDPAHPLHGVYTGLWEDYMATTFQPAQEKTMPIDLVNNPPHYKTHGSIECIEAIEAALGPYGFAAYCKGNIVKYLWRADFKEPGNRSQDLLKAKWYLHRMIERTKGDSK